MVEINAYSLKKDGEKKLSSNFKVKEFACKDGSDAVLVAPRLVMVLQSIRSHFGAPITINSAYRTPQYNTKVGGVDQSQHIEICRDIANRFNNLHPNTFTIPEGYYPKVGEGAKITSLVDPNSKMSKSDPNPNGYILLMDKPEDIMRKFKRAVTDSDSRIIFDPQNKPGVSNLLQIYALATGKTIEQAAAEFDGKGYGEFKPAVGEAVVELLRPIREKTTDLLNNKDYLEQVYKEGAQKASYLARKTLDKVYRKVGFVAR